MALSSANGMASKNNAKLHRRKTSASVVKTKHENQKGVNGDINKCQA
jgi:hypothetical protein